MWETARSEVSIVHFGRNAGKIQSRHGYANWRDNLAISLK